MFFKLAISKRGVKCSECGEVVVKDAKYFVMNHFVKGEMAYPQIEKYCLECVKKITNTEFIYYLSSLLSALKAIIPKVNEVKRDSQY